MSNLKGSFAVLCFSLFAFSGYYIHKRHTHPEIIHPEIVSAELTARVISNNIDTTHYPILSYYISDQGWMRLDLKDKSALYLGLCYNDLKILNQ